MALAACLLHLPLFGSASAVVEEDCLLKPGQCYYASPRDDLRTRFPGISDHQLDQLVNDYTIENKRLDLDINQFGLAQLYDEIRILEEMQRTGGYSDA